MKIIDHNVYNLPMHRYEKKLYKHSKKKKTPEKFQSSFSKVIRVPGTGGCSGKHLSSI